MQPATLLSSFGALDRRISSSVYKAGVAVPRPVWKLFEYSGDGLVWLALTLAALLAPSTPPAARRAWANVLLGLLIDLAIVGLLKGAARRRRPVYNALAGDMAVVVAVDRFSFPSGHSSRACFLAAYAAVVARADAPAFAAAAVVWAVALALSRCAMGRHYLSDVAAGLLVGVVTAAAVTQGRFAAEGLVLSEQSTDAAVEAVTQYVRGVRLRV